MEIYILHSGYKQQWTTTIQTRNKTTQTLTKWRNSVRPGAQKGLVLVLKQHKLTKWRNSVRPGAQKGLVLVLKQHKHLQNEGIQLDQVLKKV